MKIKQYIKLLQLHAEKHPDATVIYASDSEGNRFEEVSFAPSAGNFVGTDFDNESDKVNAICVN